MLSATMEQRIEVVHVGFLRNMKRLKEKRTRESLWCKVAAKKVLQGSGTQPIQTYLDMRQTKVAEWVHKIIIFNFNFFLFS